jgi:hypothetical protein
VSHIIFLFVPLKSRSQTFHFMGHLYEVYISQMIRYSRACGYYQDFLDRGLLLTRKLLNQGFLLAKLKSSHIKILRSPPWLGWPFWNICVTIDHWYVPLVVNPSRSFPHSRLITGFVTRITRRVSLVEQVPPTLTVSDCPFGIFKLFLWTTENRVRSNYCRGMIFCDC